MSELSGRCHCGTIAFTLRWPGDGAIAARACGCSFCTKHGGVWTSNPDAALTVRIADAQGVSRYAFGTGTAEFHVCRRCGAVPVVTSDIGGRRYAVVNVNTLEGVDPARLDRRPVSFDGEDEASRLARRARGWIGDVSFVTGAPAPGGAP
jgi:hypothetical protein